MTEQFPTYIPADDEAAVALAVDGCRALASAGQADMVWGHPSVRDPAGRGAWLKSSGWGFEEIDASRIVLVSPEGAVLAGDGPRHIEYPIHTEIMAARPDVGAVVHTHSSAACQFAALGEPLLRSTTLDHAGSLFCYPSIPRFELTGGLIKNRIARPVAGRRARRRGRLPAAAARHRRGGTRPARGGHGRGAARPRLPDPARRDGGRAAAGVGRGGGHGGQAGRRLVTRPASRGL